MISLKSVDWEASDNCWTVKKTISTHRNNQQLTNSNSVQLFCTTCNHLIYKNFGWSEYSCLALLCLYFYKNEALESNHIAVQVQSFLHLCSRWLREIPIACFVQTCLWVCCASSFYGYASTGVSLPVGYGYDIAGRQGRKAWLKFHFFTCTKIILNTIVSVKNRQIIFNAIQIVAV